MHSLRMFKPRVVALALLLTLQTVGTASAQGSAAPVTPPSEQRKTSEPYTGDLSVFESPGREDRLQINRVMDLLGIAAGKGVADIGAGSGWFTGRAAGRGAEGEAAECEDDSGQVGRSGLAGEFRGCGVAAQDVPRSCAAGGVAAKS